MSQLNRNLRGARQLNQDRRSDDSQAQTKTTLQDQSTDITRDDPDMRLLMCMSANLLFRIPKHGVNYGPYSYKIIPSERNYAADNTLNHSRRLGGC